MHGYTNNKLGKLSYFIHFYTVDVYYIDSTVYNVMYIISIMFISYSYSNSYH